MDSFIISPSINTISGQYNDKSSILRNSNNGFKLTFSAVFEKLELIIIGKDNNLHISAAVCMDLNNFDEYIYFIEFLSFIDNNNNSFLIDIATSFACCIPTSVNGGSLNLYNNVNIKY
jgi:hypothetical protein